MGTFREDIETWYRYVKANIQPEKEFKEVLEGRKAEHELRTLISSHKQFSECYIFPAKRIFDPVNRRKREADLIVVTPRKLYILECKAWSGTVVDNNDCWVQMRRDGTVITVENMVLKQKHIKNLLLNYLESHDIHINPENCVTKTVFMKPNVCIESPSIYNHPDVITPDKLQSFLDSQNSQLKKSERFIKSVVNFLLSREHAQIIIGGLFDVLGERHYYDLLDVLDKLPTWDKLYLYGGEKIIPGDIITKPWTLFAKRVPNEKVKELVYPKLQYIDVKITRSTAAFLAKTLLRIGQPIKLACYGMHNICLYKEEAKPDGYVIFQEAGKETTENYDLFRIEKIVFGKNANWS